MSLNSRLKRIECLVVPAADSWADAKARHDAGSAAPQAMVTLDGKQVAAFELFNGRGRTDGPYNSGSYPLEVGKNP